MHGSTFLSFIGGTEILEASRRLLSRSQMDDIYRLGLFIVDTRRNEPTDAYHLVVEMNLM